MHIRELERLQKAVRHVQSEKVNKLLYYGGLEAAILGSSYGLNVRYYPSPSESIGMLGENAIVVVTANGVFGIIKDNAEMYNASKAILEHADRMDDLYVHEPRLEKIPSLLVKPVLSLAKKVFGEIDPEYTNQLALVAFPVRIYLGTVDGQVLWERRQTVSWEIKAHSEFQRVLSQDHLDEFLILSAQDRLYKTSFPAFSNSFIHAVRSRDARPGELPEKWRPYFWPGTPNVYDTTLEIFDAVPNRVWHDVQELLNGPSVQKIQAIKLLRSEVNDQFGLKECKFAVDDIQSGDFDLETAIMNRIQDNMLDLDIPSDFEATI